MSPPVTPSWIERRLQALRVLRPWFFIGLPVVINLQILLLAGREHAFAVDFHHALWPAGRAVLEGRSPFPHPTIASLGTGEAFVYPAFAAVLFAPFALLPHGVADLVFTASVVGATVAALRLLGIRDYRCYGVVFLWAPVFFAVQTANVTLLLVLGAAALWRYRDRAAGAGLALASLVAVKLFVWPLFVWLVATRRYVAAASAFVLAAMLTFGSWAALGFAGIGDYVPSLRLLEKLEGPASFSLYGLGIKAGLPGEAARAIALLAGAFILAACVLVVRSRNDDRASFALAIAAALVLSPIVWLHYFALAIVALAVLRPRFSPVWLLPIALWNCPARPTGPTWLAGYALLVVGVMFGLALRRGRPQTAPAASPLPGRVVAGLARTS